MCYIYISNAGEAEDPASMPIFWVSKWVDYSDKYGLGYQLCDTSVGVLFNDSTRLLLGSDETYVPKIIIVYVIIVFHVLLHTLGLFSISTKIYLKISTLSQPIMSHFIKR